MLSQTWAGCWNKFGGQKKMSRPTSAGNFLAGDRASRTVWLIISEGFFKHKDSWPEML
jgi:hypothetical protein